MVLSMMVWDWVSRRRLLVRCCCKSVSMKEISSLAALIMSALRSLLHLVVMASALSRSAMYSMGCSSFVSER